MRTTEIIDIDGDAYVELNLLGDDMRHLHMQTDDGLDDGCIISMNRAEAIKVANAILKLTELMDE